MHTHIHTPTQPYYTLQSDPKPFAIKHQIVRVYTHKKKTDSDDFPAGYFMFSRETKTKT